MARFQSAAISAQLSRLRLARGHAQIAASRGDASVHARMQAVVTNLDAAIAGQQVARDAALAAEGRAGSLQQRAS